jgi:uncharacterized protein YyaL (SSP411 family)
MEGAFYIWHDDEIRAALGADAEVFRLRFGILPDGNAPFDPQGEFTHKNLLYTARSIEEIANVTQRSPIDVASALARARATLLAVRAQRPRPHLDDKVLTAWNGLMIAAFARAGRVLPDGERYLAAATRAASFLKSRMWDGKTLLRRYRAGDASIEAYAEDYAYLIFGLLEVFQADGNPQWLEWSLALQQRQDDLFWDPVEGGWFSTTGTDPSVLLRLKEVYDGAEPAASSVSALNLLALAHMTGDEGTAGKIERVLGSVGARLTGMGRAVPMMLAALSTYHAGMPQIVIAGRPEQDDTRALVDAVRSKYRPTAVTVRTDPARQADLARMLPWIGAMGMRDGRATAYVCRDFTCRAPTTDPEALTAEL